MFERLEAAIGSKLLYGVIWIASLCFTYWFGGHVEHEKATAVDSAVSSVSTQLGTILTNQINTQVGGINARLVGDTNAINLILQGGFKTVTMLMLAFATCLMLGCTSKPVLVPRRNQSHWYSRR